MGQNIVKYVNFEDVQYIVSNNFNNYIIINTLSSNEQNVLIKNTISIYNEVKIINNNLNKLTLKIIIYGKNDLDKKVEEKYNQLSSLGFTNIFIYRGGLFEWLLLQDIYGKDMFPTTKNELDILKYKSKRLFNNNLLSN